MQEIAKLLTTLADLASEGRVRQKIDDTLALLSVEKHTLSAEASALDVIMSEVSKNSFFQAKGAVFEQCMLTEDGGPHL